MSDPWAVSLTKEKALALAALRLWPAVRVCATGDCLWLQGPEMTDELHLALRKLPGARRFAIDATGALTPEGARLPTCQLPDGPWEPLQTWLIPAPQLAAIATPATRKIPLRLVRGDHEAPASVLVTSFAQWSAYAISAPVVRLRRLRFAIASDARVLIRGHPLPPLEGDRYVEREGIAIPCGFMLVPRIDPATVRALLGSTPEDLALFDTDGGWEAIKGEDFVHATRASVRARAEGMPK